MKKIVSWSDPSVIQKIEGILEQDMPLITTTDTILGLLARCTQKSFEALNACKGRYEKPYLVLVRDLEYARQLIDPLAHQTLESLGSALWPGEVTMIFSADATVPFFMKSADGAIALRVVDHPGLKALLAHYGVLFSTSANKAGEPAPSFFELIEPAILETVGLVVLDNKPEKAVQAPSTIIDCRGAEIRIVRHGAVSLADIRRRAGIGILD